MSLNAMKTFKYKLYKWVLDKENYMNLKKLKIFFTFYDTVNIGLTFLNYFYKCRLLLSVFF